MQATDAGPTIIPSVAVSFEAKASVSIVFISDLQFRVRVPAKLARDLLDGVSLPHYPAFPSGLKSNLQLETIRCWQSENLRKCPSSNAPITEQSSSALSWLNHKLPSSIVASATHCDARIC
jgi:hypothetical protein